MASLPTRAQVLEALFQQWHPVEKTEIIPVKEALGRVLVHDQLSQVTIPVVRASAMDGVAVSSAGFQDGPPDTSNWKLGEDFCRADTGDDFDDRFDAVIPIEQADLSADGRSPSTSGSRYPRDTTCVPGAARSGQGSSLPKRTGSCAPSIWPAWLWAVSQKWRSIRRPG